MAESGSNGVDTGPKVDIPLRPDSSAKTSAAEKGGNALAAATAATEGVAKGFSADSLKKLLGQPDMTPGKGLEAFATGAARSAAESSASPLPTPDNPLIINEPDSAGEVSVSGPKVDAGQTEATKSEKPQQQAEQKASDTQDQSKPGRWTRFTNRLSGYKPLNIPQINNLDLTNVGKARQEAAGGGNSATETLPTQPAEITPPVQDTGTDSTQPLDAAITSEDAAIKKAQDILGAENTEKTTAQQNEPVSNMSEDIRAQQDAILDDRTLTPEQRDQAMQDVAKSEQKNEQAKTNESERTMNQRERKVVETFAKLNPDFDSSDPDTAKFLDEIAADENKMQLVEKAIDLIGKPNNLEDFLKLLQKPLQENETDVQQTKEMNWLLRLLLELGLAFTKIPVEELKQVAQIDQK